MRTLRNIFIVFSLLWGSAAYAQSVDPVRYIIAPEAPGPREQVQLTLQGVGAFLGEATITWYNNGTVAQSGIGLTSYTFTTRGIGEQTIVRVRISSAVQGLIEKTFTFNPSTINLVWESDTSVPPLYKGKSLYSAGSPLTIVAFPSVTISGRRVSASSLSYQWRLNDEPLSENSGTGKYILHIEGNQFQPGQIIAVDAYFGSQKVGHSEITIPVTEPSIVLYPKDPLRGVLWDNAIPPQGISRGSKELAIQAQLYFFSRSALASGAVELTWAINNTPVSGPDSAKGLLVLRQSADGQGEALLKVSAQNNIASQLLQSARTLLRITFGATSNSLLSSFFGL